MIFRGKAAEDFFLSFQIALGIDPGCVFLDLKLYAGCLPAPWKGKHPKTRTADPHKFLVLHREFPL